MDQLSALTQLQTLLHKEIDLINRELSTAKSTRDHAPSAMESHSDTTRSEQEKLFFALQEKLQNTQNHLKILNKLIFAPTSVSIHSTNINSQPTILVVVPDGLGGRKIDNLLFVSASAPILKTISKSGPLA